MNYYPTHSDSGAVYISSICIIGGIISYAASKLDIFAPILMQLIGVILLAAGIYILTRYKLTEFCYTLKREDDSGDAGEAEFSVSRIQGKHSLRLCAFTISDLKLIKPLTAKNAKLDEAVAGYGKSITVYNYCVNLKPSNPYILIFDNRDGTYAAIVAEPGIELVKYTESLLALIEH